jgi:hypothetical protein
MRRPFGEAFVWKRGSENSWKPDGDDRGETLRKIGHRTEHCELVGPTRQDLARTTGLAAGKKRYRISDPAQDLPSAYWR